MSVTAGAATNLLGQFGQQPVQQGQQGQQLGQQGQQDEPLVAVPLSIFGPLLGQLGGLLGGKIGGPTGSQIGTTLGQLGSTFLPFQVLPSQPGLQPQSTGPQGLPGQQGQQQGQQGQQQDDPLIAVPLSIFGPLLGQLGGFLGGKIAGSTGSQIGSTIAQIGSSFLPFQVLPSGAQQSGLQPQSVGRQGQQGQQDDPLVAVPLSIFGPLLGQLGSFLGGKIGGPTGSQIGAQIGQIGSSFLPFQVLPPASGAGVNTNGFAAVR
jgi:hypothetical protein